jgi:hypothetical protein
VILREAAAIADLAARQQHATLTQLADIMDLRRRVLLIAVAILLAPDPDGAGRWSVH